MWLKFTSDFDWEPPELKGRAVIAYRAGMVKFVRKECAKAALESGKAQKTKRPEGVRRSGY